MPFINNQRFTIKDAPPFTWWGLLPHHNYKVKDISINELEAVYTMEETNE